MYSHPAELKRLNLVDTRVGSSAVRALGGFWRPGRTGENLPGLLQLTDLDLHGVINGRDMSSQQGVWLGPLSSLRHLRRLGIGASELQPFDDLDRLTELRVLDLHDRTSPLRPLEDSNVRVISRLANLRVLRLSLPPTAKQLRLLRPLTRLEQIDVLADGHPTEEFRTLLAKTLPFVKTTANLAALGDQAAFRFAQTPLKDALQHIATQYEITVHLDTKAVEAAGVSADEPVDGEFAGMTLDEALTVLVGELNLKVIPHAGGVTVTSRGTQAIWEREHDLSPLLEGLENAAHHTSHLALTLERLTDSSLWGRKGTVLANGHVAPGATAVTGISHRGTRLVVTAGQSGHDQVDAVVEQLLNPESLLTSVKWHQALDRNSLYRRNGQGALTTSPIKASFVDTPLIDVLQYLSLQYEASVLLDVDSAVDAGVAADTPVNLICGPKSLAEMLNAVLNPLKLTWLVEDDVIKVVSPQFVLQRPTIVVHQFDELRLLGKLEPTRFADDYRAMFDAIIKSGTLAHDVSYGTWLNRTLVSAPWPSHRKLAQFVKRLMAQQTAEVEAR